MIRGRVVEVLKPGRGHVCNDGELRVEITEAPNKMGWKKGDIVRECADMAVPPCKIRFNSDGFMRINTGYTWVK